MAKTSGTRDQQFLSRLTHELRTPLGSILMLSELLAENRAGGLSEKDLSYVEKIRQAATDVHGLIDDVGLLNRIASGRLEPSLAKVSLRKLCGKLESRSEPAEPPRIRVCLTGNLPTSFETDGEILLRILGILSDEARQGSDEATVSLSVSSPSSGLLCFAIRVGGPPVPQDQLQAFFEPFGVAGRHGRRRYGGQSLALPIAERLSWLLGGALRLRTRPDGDALELELPIDDHSGG